jgi:hypothetical protein
MSSWREQEMEMERHEKHGNEMYAKGQRDAIAAAVARVEALFKDAHRLMSDGIYSYFVPSSDEVIAAIKGDSDE